MYIYMIRRVVWGLAVFSVAIIGGHDSGNQAIADIHRRKRAPQLGCWCTTQRRIPPDTLKQIYHVHAKVPCLLLGLRV